MEKINLPFLYHLSADLNRLAQINPPQAGIIDIVLASLQTQLSVQTLFNSFPTLTVCRAVGKGLLEAMDAVNKLLEGKKPDEWRKRPEPSEQYRIQQVISKVREFETVLTAELQTLAVYQAAQKGIYATADLIERAENSFPESVKVKLPPSAVEDIRQSGRCLAFDNATACGFHIMRATEAVMHEYYVVVCKAPDCEQKLDSWAAYIGALSKSSEPDVKEVVALLYQIKGQHRNLIMHPEVVLSPDDAFTLFEVAQGAIIAMAGRLRSPKK